MKFHIRKHRGFNNFWRNLKIDSAEIINEIKNYKGQTFVTVDLNFNQTLNENDPVIHDFAKYLTTNYKVIPLNDDLTLKFPDRDMSTTIYMKVVDIVSADTKLSVLKNKRNNFMKLKDKIENNMNSSRNLSNSFGMHDDCGEDYIREEKEADARYALMKELEIFLPADEVIDQSRIVGSLKKDFEEKHPEFYETMLSILHKAQKNRENLAQNNLKRKKTIYKSAANIVMAMNGFMREAKENKIYLDKSIKDRIRSVSSTSLLTFNINNPVKELPEHFRIYPEKVDSVISLAKEIVQFDMAKERKKLITSLLSKIENSKTQYVKKDPKNV